MEQFPFYQPFNSIDFFYERCFLCGCDFENTQRTDEHIFPKWLQHKFNLWNESLTILNNTCIQYRFLTIPCCNICNGIHLSQMEERFKVLLDREFNELSEAEEKTIFQWTAKILYGTLYKELSLKLDRKNPNLGNILSPPMIENFSTLHLFLQSIRIATEFNAPKPWSIFSFNYMDDAFHYINDIQGLCFSIKLGTVGITIAFEDNNAIENFMGRMKYLKEFKLNSIQFLEISSKIFYAKRLAENAPSYLTSYNKNVQVMHVNTLNSIRGKEWNDEEYAFFFEQILETEGIKEGRPLFYNGTLNTFLVDEDGELMVRKIRKT